MGGHCVYQICRNDRLYHLAVRWDLAVCLLLAQHIIAEQSSRHVSCQRNILAGFIVLYIDAQTICVRICRQYQIRILLLRQLKPQLKGLLCLRIRIAYSREIAVRQLLLRHNIHMLKAQLLHNAAGRNISCAVKRSVDNGNLILHSVNRRLVHYLGLHLGNVLVVNLSSDGYIQAAGLSLLPAHSPDSREICDCHNLLRHSLIVGRSKLGAVLPVYLVAVVLRRIVAGRNINSGDTAQLPHCKGQLRRRTQRFKAVRLDSVGRQSAGRLIGKLRGHTAGIVGNGNASLSPSLL